jgi:hypothetical protein
MRGSFPIQPRRISRSPAPSSMLGGAIVGADVTVRDAAEPSPAPRADAGGRFDPGLRLAPTTSRDNPSIRDVPR